MKSVQNSMTNLCKYSVNKNISNIFLFQKGHYQHSLAETHSARSYQQPLTHTSHSGEEGGILCKTGGCRWGGRVLSEYTCSYPEGSESLQKIHIPSKSAPCPSKQTPPLDAWKEQKHLFSGGRTGGRETVSPAFYRGKNQLLEIYKGKLVTMSPILKLFSQFSSHLLSFQTPAFLQCTLAPLTFDPNMKDNSGNELVPVFER